MKSLPLIVLSMVYSQVGFADKCTLDASYLFAKYVIETQQVTQNASLPTKTLLTLWRKGDEVAHEKNDLQITEIWNQLSNKRMRPIRYFDEYQRGIEYHPGEMLPGSVAESWSAKYQLISDQFIQKMTLIKTEQKGCDTIEQYHYSQDELKIDLTWLPKLKLIKSYKEANAKKKTTISLQYTETNKVTINAFFEKRSHYQTTDYADIGDNESDPFLAKMINLGFVEHGASGFYDATGHAMNDQHHH